MVLGQSHDVVVERVEPGGGQDAGLAHRAPTRRARTAGAMSAARPAITLPTGQPSPFDKATDTTSNGAASSARCACWPPMY